jgi:hypothetical protein
MAKSVITNQYSAALTATGVSGGFVALEDTDNMDGRFNFSVWGTFVGTFRVLRSFDGGTTKLPCTDSAGAAVTFSGPLTIVMIEPENGVTYYIEVTAYTSGSIFYRFSK